MGGAAFILFAFVGRGPVEQNKLRTEVANGAAEMSTKQQNALPPPEPHKSLLRPRPLIIIPW